MSGLGDDGLPTPTPAEPTVTALTPLGPVPGGQEITVSVYLRRRPDLVESPVFVSPLERGLVPRPPLPPNEFAARFGAAPDDIALVERFAAEKGLNVVSTSLDERLVRLAGGAEAVGQAFGVELQRIRVVGGTFHTFIGDIVLPDALKPVVVGVYGLDTTPLVPSPPVTSQQNWADTDYPAGDAELLTLKDLAKLYAFPVTRPGSRMKLDGGGQTIAVLRLGGRFAMSDFKRVVRGLGLPGVANVKAIGKPVTQPSAQAERNARIETAADVEVILALAPKAKIRVYYADAIDSDGLIRLVNKVRGDRKNRPSIMSISWGMPELMWSGGTGDQAKALDLALEDAAREMTICAASGDWGSMGIAPSQGSPDGRANIVLPAASQWVLACGGSIVVADGSRISREVVWNEPGYATGGGVSEVFRPPAWQQGTGVPRSANPGRKPGRGIPDVAAHAGRTRILIGTIIEKELPIGGTSTAAPIWAALIARINQALDRNVGYINQFLYEEYASGRGRAAFRSITSGNNKHEPKDEAAALLAAAQMGDVPPDESRIPYYTAKAGWDACTGLGSPVGDKLLELLARKP